MVIKHLQQFNLFSTYSSYTVRLVINFYVTTNSFSMRGEVRRKYLSFCFSSQSRHTVVSSSALPAISCGWMCSIRTSHCVRCKCNTHLIDSNFVFVSVFVFGKKISCEFFQKLRSEKMFGSKLNFLPFVLWGKSKKIKIKLW